MESDKKVQFSDFLLAYAKTRPSISPETIQSEAQTLYTRLLDNPDSLHVCYNHFLHTSDRSKNEISSSNKRKRSDEEPTQPRKKQKLNKAAVVDLTVEPKRHVTRSKTKPSIISTSEPVYNKKRTSKIVGILPKGPTQWYGVVHYRKAEDGPLKEKRTPGCVTENEAVEKINYILKKIKVKDYLVDRTDYGKRLSAEEQQVLSLQEMKQRRSQRKRRTAVPANPNDVILIETEFPKTSKYNGVSWDSKVDRWVAAIQTRTVSKRIIRGGYFTDEIKAGKCVNDLCARNGMSPLNPSLCVDSIIRKVVYGKKSKYVGIVYRPADDQWHCDLKYRKPNARQVYHVNDGHGLWDSDEQELVKRVKTEVLRLKQNRMVTIDFEYGTTKLNRAPNSKYVGLEFDIDHGRWACWIQYKQPHSDITSTKLLGYETDQHKLAEAARNWMKNKKADSRIQWTFLEEYGVSKLDLNRRNRAMRQAQANQGDKDLYEVQRIIEWKITEEGRKYHVQWASAEDEYTWEPEEHVLHLELFREFHKRNIERIQQQRDLELQRQQIKPTYSFPSPNYKGVLFDTRDCKWHASLTVCEKTLRGGALDNELDAALAVNSLCKQANKPLLNRGIDKIVRHQLYSTSAPDKERIFWIRTNGNVYFPTNRDRRFLHSDCYGKMPPLEAPDMCKLRTF